MTTTKVLFAVSAVAAEIRAIVEDSAKSGMWHSGAPALRQDA